MQLIVSVQFLHRYKQKSMQIAYGDGFLLIVSLSYSLSSKCFGLF